MLIELRRLFRFSQIDKLKTENLIPKDKYVYAPEQLKKINDPKFIQKLQEIEAEAKPKKYQLKSLQFPILLCAGTIFAFHLWQVVPYQLIFKHATISAYTKDLIYPMFAATLSFQDREFFAYFPMLLYALHLNGKHMSTGGMMAIYLGGTLISSLVAYFYETYKNNEKGIPIMSPQTLGQCTTLAFASAFAGHSPKYMIRNQIPYSLLVGLMAVYQTGECFNEFDTQSRVTFLASMLYGVVFGIIFKRIYP